MYKYFSQLLNSQAVCALEANWTHTGVLLFEEAYIVIEFLVTEANESFLTLSWNNKNVHCVSEYSLH